ncbi:MAG: exostosin family protein [Ferruginibacter sp.]|nr:exostosin family protein [Ferruginibacter sp.]
MKVFLTSSIPYYEEYNFDPPGWLKSKSEAQVSICTDDPDLADIIIFVESHPGDDPYFRKVFNHALFKKYPRKCVLYHDADLSITPLPTLSPSIESWQYDPRHKRTFHYISRHTENQTVDQSPLTYTVNRDYLYSFMGSKTHEVRNKIFKSKHPADTFIKDTTGHNAWDLDDADKIIYEREYLDIIHQSSFVLSPRGIGPCSYRLFESMQLGRVPVIISDAWVKIPGIDWDQFTITIPEAQIHRIPEILRERKNEAVEMGKLARKYWEDYFSPGVSLSLIVIAAEELLKHNYSYIDALKDYSQFLRHPWHLRNFFRYKKNQLLSRLQKTGLANTDG